MSTDPKPHFEGGEPVEGLAPLGVLAAAVEVRDPRVASLEPGRDADPWQMADPIPMSGYVRRALRGLIRALCPPEPAPQLERQEDRIEDAVRLQLRYMPRPAIWLVKLATVLFDLAPLWCLVSWRRLRSLDRSRAAALFQRLCASRFALLRTLTLVVRAPILSTYYDQPEVHEAIGYAPVPFMREKIALRLRMLAGETARPDDHILHTLHLLEMPEEPERAAGGSRS